MDWLLLRGLLNARLYPHKVKTARGRLNTKQIFYVVGYLGFMIFACNLMLSPVRASSVATATPDYVSTVWYSYTMTASAVPTFTSFPTSTSVPTFTPIYDPSPSPTPSLVFPASALSPAPSVNTNVTEYQTFALSFYDPHIGAYFPDIAGVNCLEFDFSIKDCVSRVHHGQDDYRQWYGKGAACPDVLPYDAVFRVHTPVELSGIWRCIDVGDLSRNGLHYIDFMLQYPEMVWTGRDLNSFPWSSDVVIEVLSTP